MDSANQLAVLALKVNHQAEAHRSPRIRSSFLRLTRYVS
jgi:hypothetical protein